MDWFFEASWRIPPAAVLMAAGTLMVLRALPRTWQAPGRPRSDMHRMVIYVTGFRRIVMGLALTALGAAWIWQHVWLLAVALAVGGVELLESSYYLWAMRQGDRQRTREVPKGKPGNLNPPSGE